MRLAVRADRGQIMQASNMRPDAWQSEILNSTGDLLAVTSRQAGKTSTVAALVAAHLVADPAARVLLVAPGQRQSGLMLDRVQEYLARVAHAPYQRRSRSEVLLDGGAHCWAVPASSGTIRGFDALTLLVCDEAAFVPDSIFSAVMPMLATSGGRMIMISTPAGRRGFFYDSYADPHSGFSTMEVTADRISRLPQEFLDQQQRRMPEHVYRSEYFCSFEVMEGGLFDPALLQAAGIDEDVEASPTFREWLRGEDAKARAAA